MQGEPPDVAELRPDVADPTLVRVKLFGGLSNLPVFAKHGLRVEVEQTPDSDVLRKGLASGAFEIAAAGVDNALAMVDTDGADAIIVMGGDSAMNSLIVQPEITSIAALRGKQVIVDAPNTAYALVAKKILALNGLQAGRDYTIVRNHMGIASGAPSRWIVASTTTSRVARRRWRRGESRLTSSLSAAPALLDPRRRRWST